METNHQRKSNETPNLWKILQHLSRERRFEAEKGARTTKNFAEQTSPLNWKSRLIIASTFPPNETEREESVDLTSAERELDLRRKVKILDRLQIIEDKVLS